MDITEVKWADVASSRSSVRQQVCDQPRIDERDGAPSRGIGIMYRLPWHLMDDHGRWAVGLQGHDTIGQSTDIRGNRRAEAIGLMADVRNAGNFTGIRNIVDSEADGESALTPLMPHADVGDG
jgi:hypothetical protein